MKTEGAVPGLVLEDNDEDFDLHQTGRYAGGQTASRPGRILLDLNLAGLDGRQVLEHLEGDAHLESIPVIVFSTSDNPKDVQSAYAHGASGYLLKPVDLSRFERMIQLFKDFWLDPIVLPEGDSREGARR